MNGLWLLPVVLGVVFAVNLLPALGPPTWAVLVWFRLPPMAHDTVWAEDGRLFLFGAEQHGLFGVIFVPYAGYLQFVPRLIAGAVVQWLPAADWALGMTAGACLVTGAIACVVFVASRDVLTCRLNQ